MKIKLILPKYQTNYERVYPVISSDYYYRHYFTYSSHLINGISLVFKKL